MRTFRAPDGWHLRGVRWKVSSGIVQKMRHVTLISNPSTPDGTFGVMLLDDHSSFCTGELPWKNNANGVSCIPAGTYTCHWIDSPKHGWCYQILNVPNRSMIEIHSANWMGDVSKGKLSQLLGCIALGITIGQLNGQTALLRSKQAIADFEANLKQADFQLTIIRKEVPC